MGGILNCFLDPLFMFVILPQGNEVTGAAIATTISNAISCLYLLYAYQKAGSEAPLSMNPRDALRTEAADRKAVFSVGIPSALLTGLFDLANICVNIIASSHNDLVLAGMGIVFWKVGVDQDLVKGDTFSSKCLKDEIVDRPEGVFRERIGAQSVLVAHHDKLEIELLTDETEVAKHAIDKLQFLKAVNLFVGRLLNESAITVYK
jgi:hypothetical protein